MSDWTFIYALVDPRDGRVRYVGKSNRPYSRATQHLNANAHTNGRKAEWTSDLKAAGLKPRVLILGAVLMAEWEAAEKCWIAHARAVGCPLVNIVSGGNGQSEMTEEARARIRESQIGRKRSPEELERQRLSHLGQRLSPERAEALHATTRGKPAWNRGLRPSDETIRKIAARLLGRKHTEEAKAKIGRAHKGRPMHPLVKAAVVAANVGRTLSPEHRAKIAKAGTGRKHTPEHRAYMSRVLAGRVFSDETRAKMSASAKERKRREALEGKPPFPPRRQQ